MKRTILESVTQEDNALQLRFAKQTLDDNGNITASRWHRAAILPNTDVTALMADVQSHLEHLGDAPISNEDLQTITTHAQAFLQGE